VPTQLSGESREVQPPPPQGGHDRSTRVQRFEDPGLDAYRELTGLGLASAAHAYARRKYRAAFFGNQRSKAVSTGSSEPTALDNGRRSPNKLLRAALLGCSGRKQ
jgi:hypothetical protein